MWSSQKRAKLIQQIYMPDTAISVVEVGRALLLELCSCNASLLREESLHSFALLCALPHASQVMQWDCQQLCVHLFTGQGPAGTEI